MEMQKFYFNFCQLNINFREKPAMATYNKKIRITASVLGVLLGTAGILNHGLFEILQGKISTNGFFIDAIGEAHRFWVHGTEGAFTIVHNFLITGILVVLTGLAIVFWTVKYIHVKHGSTVLLFLFIVLTLVGGGIGFIVLYVPTWAFATLINKRLSWWGKVLPFAFRKKLSALWIYSLLATSISWLMVMELGIFGFFPGQSDPDAILNIVFGFLFLSVFFACLTFVCAIAGDIEKQSSFTVT